VNHRLVMSKSEWIGIKEHLFRSDVEEAAVVFATATVGDGNTTFTYFDKSFLSPDDFNIQTAYHIELTDDARGRIIKTAWDSKTSIVEFHSHVGNDAAPVFSPSDLEGFADFVPHVRWRLRGKPYAAVVVASTGFDALVWSADREGLSETLSAVVLNDSELKPTGLTKAWMPNAAF
jgi:hypothetical protein